MWEQKATIWSSDAFVYLFLLQLLQICLYNGTFLQKFIFNGRNAVDSRLFRM